MYFLPTQLIAGGLGRASSSVLYLSMRNRAAESVTASAGSGIFRRWAIRRMYGVTCTRQVARPRSAQARVRTSE